MRKVYQLVIEHHLIQDDSLFSSASYCFETLELAREAKRVHESKTTDGKIGAFKISYLIEEVPVYSTLTDLAGGLFYEG